MDTIQPLQEDWTSFVRVVVAGVATPVGELVAES
jgi:hypothetical protein